MDGSFKVTSVKNGVILSAILFGLGGLMTWSLLASPEPKLKTPLPVELARSRVIAKRELKPYTLLTDGDLEAKTVSQQTSVTASITPPKVEEFTGRYLLGKVESGGEIKREMIAPREATPLLANAVAVGIPASSTTSIGGRLQAGEMVDLLATAPESSQSSADQSARLRKFENLMVLHIATGNEEKAPEKQGAPHFGIILAVPATRRDEFATATAGASLLVTRRIVIQ